MLSLNFVRTLFYSKKLKGSYFSTLHEKLTIFESVESGQLQSIPSSNIRNFSVIAHVDHGKSTLSDCILQLTGNIGEKDKKRGDLSFIDLWASISRTYTFSMSYYLFCN